MRQSKPSPTHGGVVTRAEGRRSPQIGADDRPLTGAAPSFARRTGPLDSAVGAVLLSLALLASTACGGVGASTGDGDGTARGAGGAGSGSAGPAAGDGFRVPDVDLDAALAELPPVAVAPAVVTALEPFVEGCKFYLDKDQMSACPSQLNNDFSKWVRENKTAVVFESMTELALRADDPSMRVAALSQLNAARGAAGKRWLEENSTRQMGLRAVELLRQTKTVTGAGAAAQHAGDIAWPSGVEDELLAVLASHPEDSARRLGIPAMTTTGRVDAFRYAEHVAAADPEWVPVALGSIRTMGDLSADEREVLCPWAAQHLPSEDSKLALSAGEILTLRCKPESIPTVLADGERRLAEGAIDERIVQLYRSPCFGGPVQTAGSPAEDHCPAVFDFLEKIANAENLDSKVRGKALWNIYYQDRSEATAERLEPYLDHPDPVIREEVKKAIDSIRG